ncbi:MAG: WecB/TagA/CpsF family glycosyltransferase [Ignavibacteriae bacterium]|nr:WecB/TagA/CpsF family glycosyltransferase [Ignavibacteriota bacterium]
MANDKAISNMFNSFNVVLNPYSDDFLRYINDCLENRRKLVLSYLNAYTCEKYQKSLFLESGVPFYFIPDGVGIHIGLKMLGLATENFSRRVVSTDFWYYLLTFLNKNHINCTIIGGQRNHSDKTILYFEKNFSNINIVSVYDGYSCELGNLKISNNSDLLVIGLGTPQQEQWIIDNYSKLESSIIILVGSAIDFWSGAKKRAPVWMQKTGLEWLYRLFQEPKRLWKRYIIGIPVFMFNIILIKVKLMFNKEST